MENKNRVKKKELEKRKNTFRKELEKIKREVKLLEEYRILQEELLS